ncbi:hypothetical protein ZWY2020_007485 [Hordeum vulgare]|nr:hypothetical protein ZWY2020_007485 [Hordeum vulgare]
MEAGRRKSRVVGKGGVEMWWPSGKERRRRGGGVQVAASSNRRQGATAATAAAAASPAIGRLSSCCAAPPLVVGARRLILRAMRLSFRQDADMAGAIFMCNTWAREQFFGSGIFRLALEYQPFVDNVKQGMPLFLFDYNEGKLYGVFEAVTDGGLDITDRAAFRSTGRSYPAQVRFKIIWKCRPLAEDEFSHAIKENYYTLYKFYFDLSYQQVVQLYELFDNKRVEQPIRNYTISAHSKEGHFSKGRPDKRSLNPNISPLSTDQSHTLILTAGTKYSAPTSMCGTVPHNFEARTNLSMPS